MGFQRQLHRGDKKELSENNKAYRLSKELQHFYANHFLSPWQKTKIGEIRALYEHKQKGLDRAHDIASSRLSEEFMQFELDYAFASDQFKKENPGKEWAPSGIKGLLSKAFWVNLVRKGRELGVNLVGHGKEISEQK
ncbi:MAG: hypothetical protein AAB964_01970 [Patescibacteria group bacterium]